ncbi:NAD(P)H-hydrate dehydratase [Clostridium sp. SHJSY1]|uniref:NAD(P)H-hydrate dehydratase n=1 Tax=Clostridium sp. SHJSY1 TaxID=2942483 RepID=UPI002875F422|nr:NAD(P)H-hydrate dehydratase [Clostridium sp. SHJSY1]MDS0526212.1 NAD(P)H-hydrate dehydratase [Clostridium sp. SHJSY1]
MEILSTEAAKALDSYTINEIGIQGIVLMENAGYGITNELINKGENFIFICGIGNNGGDGLVVARKLIIENKKVKIYIVGDTKKVSYGFKVNYEILTKMSVDLEFVNIEDNIEKIKTDIQNADIVVDAIFGIGLNRKIEGEIHKLIDLINQYSRFTIAIDNPSGLDCNTGNPLGLAIKAKETLVIEVFKKGYFNLKAKKFLGKITVIKIGIPKNVVEKYSENIKMLEDLEYKRMMPIREVYGHKGSYGKVLILAGSQGFTGAAYLVTEAAVRTGAGLVTLLVEKEIQSLMSAKLTEAMTICYDEKVKIEQLINKVDIIICGPGLGCENKNKDMLEKCISNSKCPILIDADGLNIISEKESLLKKLKGRAVFTPHPGEMARLTKKSIEYIESNRIDVCRRYSKDYGVITVLKGYNTIISDGDSVIINNTGSSKMASGGMGDCLSGIIGSLIAQGMEIFSAAKLGCHIHGTIGDLVGKENYVVNARDIIVNIPKVMQYILTK